jgi:hypothetical protein
MSYYMKTKKEPVINNCLYFWYVSLSIILMTSLLKKEEGERNNLFFFINVLFTLSECEVHLLERVLFVCCRW